MLLKRLEIFGFKSFSDKAVIDFPPGISSVVGPNGCGKSNILDAIKWVMGEQSIKQLRGKSMGDVIFSGTDKRPPLNMAEVSLVLSNDGAGGSEPVQPYSEVMITRRIYRSGETAYLLNKQPCRLKDIQNIFLASGMGSKSCAIVQQGNIGAITEASPEERRSFIEEAAGVMRYKSRKKEALSKIETTRRNLDRLNDIIDEVEQQLSELSREADKARSYKSLKERLKEKNIRIAVYYYLKYAARIEKIEADLASLSKKDSEDEESLENLKSRLRQRQSESSAMEEAVSEKKADKEKKQREIERLEADLAYRRQEKKRLADEISELEESCRELVEKDEKLEQEISEEEENNSRLASSISSIKSELREKEENLRGIREELETWREKKEEQKTRLMELSSYRARYQNIYQNAEAGRESLKTKLERLNTDEEEAEQNVAELSEAEEEEKKIYESLSSEHERLGLKMEELRKTLSEKNEALAARVKKVNTLSNERSKCRSRHNALKKMEENYEWYRDGVKAVMKNPEAAAGSGGRILATVGEVITPEPGFEAALEACLGEALQFIIVSDEKAALNSVEFLREQDSGRCGFMPVEENPDGHREPEGEESDASYLLSRLAVKSGFEEPVRRLLGNALVADDLDKALELRLSRPEAAIVTRSGDLVSPSGVIVGGSSGKLAGIYEKKSEIRQLAGRIQELDRSLEEEGKVQSELEQKVRSLETELHEAGNSRRQAEKDLVQKEKDLYKTSERLKHARRRHEIVCLEKERLEGEKEDIESEIQEHSSALEAVEQEISEAEEESERIQNKIDELSESVKSDEQREMDLKLELTRLQAEFDSSNSALKRLRRFSRESKDKIEETRSETASKKSGLESAEKAVSVLEKKISEKGGELEELKKSLKSDEKAYQALLKEIKSINSTISGTRQSLEEAREKRHQMELELSRCRINQENVVNSFLEQYSEPFARYAEEYRQAVESPDFSIERTEEERAECRKEIDALGEVNLGAIEAYDTRKERRDFLVKHRDDLLEAVEDLQNVVQRINRITRKLFNETFNAVNEKFQDLFPRLFEGGKAWLELTQPGSPLETGVELMVNPPGKKVTRLSLLSGGEKALSAIAFIFSVFMINPASFCLLDEIDAALDDANIHRFNELLKIIGEKSQIIMVTHNKKSMEFSQVLYGITMGEGGASRVVSVNVDEIINGKGRASMDNPPEAVKEMR